MYLWQQKGTNPANGFARTLNGATIEKVVMNYVQINGGSYTVATCRNCNEQSSHSSNLVGKYTGECLTYRNLQI